MSTNAALLNPISEANPGGDDVRYEPVYDQIKEARREELDLPTGGWEKERKVADPVLVIKLATDVLANRSKDLQIAAWLTEARLRREGIAGLRNGLDLLHDLLAQFWDHLYPEDDEGDLEFRAAPLDWIGSQLERVVWRVEVNQAGHSYLDYMESRTVPLEEEADTQEKIDERAAALEGGKLAPEEFDSAFSATSKGWYKQLVADLDATFESLDALDRTGRERFEDVAPGYSTLRKALQEVRRVAGQLLARKLEADPDPIVVEPAAGEPGSDAVGEDAPAATSAGADAVVGGGTLSAEPTTVADAVSRVVGAARFLRRQDPADPAPYLLLRGLRWGELRGGGDPLDPKLLEAPSSQARAQLKGLLLDGEWSRLLEATETLMSTPAGRGWLDLQRYAATACEELGDEYRPVRTAILSALRGLLADLPALPDTTLMDDLPTASPDTRAWLKTEGLLGSNPQGADMPDAERDLPQAGTHANGRDRAWERAMAEVRAGRGQKAIEILSRELEHETSQRSRFLRQAQLAHVLVETGFDGVANPILQQMLTTIDELKLEAWEAGPTVAQPLALLYRCVAKAEGDPEILQSLYLRLCQLDPVQAISVRQS